MEILWQVRVSSGWNWICWLSSCFLSPLIDLDTFSSLSRKRCCDYCSKIWVFYCSTMISREIEETSPIIRLLLFRGKRWSKTQPFCWATLAWGEISSRLKTFDPHACSTTYLFKFFFWDTCGEWNGHMVIFLGMTSEGLYRSCTPIIRFLCRVSCTRPRSSGCS